jgi:hypothetical protein
MRNPPLLLLGLLVGLSAWLFSQRLWWRIHRRRSLFSDGLPDRTSGETIYPGDYLQKWLPTAALVFLAVSLVAFSFVESK